MKLVTLKHTLDYASHTAPDVLAFTEVGFDGEFPKTEVTIDGEPFIRDVTASVSFSEDEHGLHITFDYVPYYEEEYGPHENEYAGSVTGGALFLSKQGIPITENNLDDEEWERYVYEKEWPELMIVTTCKFMGFTYDVVGYFSED